MRRCRVSLLKGQSNLSSGLIAPKGLGGFFPNLAIVVVDDALHSILDNFHAVIQVWTLYMRVADLRVFQSCLGNAEVKLAFQSYRANNEGRNFCFDHGLVRERRDLVLIGSGFNRSVVLTIQKSKVDRAADTNLGKDGSLALLAPLNWNLSGYLFSDGHASDFKM